MAKTAQNKLTPKQEMFCREYLVDLNATQAAIRAGYSVRTAKSQGQRLLTKVDVSERLKVLQGKRAEKVEVTADYVLTTIIETVERCKQATPVFDKQGNHVMVELPTGETAPAYKFDSFAVLKGAELLGKHLAMFAEKKILQNPDGSNLIPSSVDVNLNPAEAYLKLINGGSLPFSGDA